MKNLLCLIFLFSVSLISAQINYDQTIISNYVEFAKFNTESMEFVTEEEGEVEFVFSPEEDYYIFDSGEEKIQINWTYYKEESEDGMDTYGSEAGEKIVFNYEDQSIWIFTEYDESINYYTDLMILSKLAVIDKRAPGEYVPQSVRQ
tara:strand:+ start:415 stop:855 length:441 start_codon:yes stop_codon:yes gene_type:complete